MTLHSVSRPFSRLFRGIDKAVAVWASRRDLERMDDRMLKDLGLSRAQAAFEAQRAPWDVARQQRGR